MIRQFGFTWTAISWLLMGYGLFFALSPLQAQTAIKKFSLELKNESLPEALKQLEKAGGKNILFTYNGTESYRVTVSIHEKTEREAIDLVLTGKPFLCIEREEYFVVQRKKSDKAIAIAGKVYDEKGAPLPFVNILALAADSSFLAGSVTEEDGSFHLPPVAGEDCLLKATYIGYRPQIIPCRQQNTIRLQPDTELLKEVVITASRPLIERKDGTLKANIAGTPLSLMGSAKEMISHLPFVTGSDGEFTVLGRGTPEIYINGRKVRDKTELDRLQANEILSAEIITTPGVQYGSSVGAVIRLRTIRKRGQGMSGSFYTDYSQGREPIGNEGISLNYRTGGLDIFVKGDFAEINNYRTGTSSQDIYASSNWNQSTEDKSKQTYRTFNGELGFNYEIDEDQSFGMRYMPGTNIGNAHTTNEGTTLILQDGKEVDHLHALRQTDAHTGWWQAANGYYNGTSTSTPTTCTAGTASVNMPKTTEPKTPLRATAYATTSMPPNCCSPPHSGKANSVSAQKRHSPTATMYFSKAVSPPMPTTASNKRCSPDSSTTACHWESSTSLPDCAMNFNKQITTRKGFTKTTKAPPIATGYR